MVRSTDTALRWFSSYLSGRSQSVKIDESRSKSTRLECGVPQGSVLGPILFSLYTAPLSKIIGTFPTVKYLLYTDDTQIYISIMPSNASNSIKDIQGCLSSVQSWMSANRLKLNPNKTEFIVFGNKRQQAELAPFFPADILGNRLVPADTVKNLGVKFDSCLNMSKQVSNILSSCYYHTKDLRRIRRHLTKSVAITLCNALVGSRIDYCNSLYYGISVKQMQRLQGVQNTLCRIVTRTHRFSSITGPLMSLHWLPVKFRVQFKLGLITYKVYKNNYPAYFWKITCCLIGAYILLGTANLLVICLAFHIITINSTNTLHNCNIVFSIQLHDCGTHFLRFVDVHLHWVRFVLIWRHISGRSQSRHSFLLYKYFWLVPDLFSDHGLWLWLSQWFVRPECVFNAD